MDLPFTYSRTKRFIGSLFNNYPTIQGPGNAYQIVFGLPFENLIRCTILPLGFHSLEVPFIFIQKAKGGFF